MGPESEMTGKQRMQTIQRHVMAWANVRLARFMAGEIGYLPCWGDEVDDLIAVELDKISDPLRIGLWVWEDQP